MWWKYIFTWCWAASVQNQDKMPQFKKLRSHIEASETDYWISWCNTFQKHLRNFCWRWCKQKITNRKCGADFLTWCLNKSRHWPKSPSCLQHGRDSSSAPEWKSFINTFSVFSLLKFTLHSSYRLTWYISQLSVV